MGALEYVLGQKRNIVGMNKEERNEKKTEMGPFILHEYFLELIDYMLPRWN